MSTGDCLETCRKLGLGALAIDTSAVWYPNLKKICNSDVAVAAVGKALVTQSFADLVAATTLVWFGTTGVVPNVLEDWGGGEGFHFIFHFESSSSDSVIKFAARGGKNGSELEAALVTLQDLRAAHAAGSSTAKFKLTKGQVLLLLYVACLCCASFRGGLCLRTFHRT